MQELSFSVHLGITTAVKLLPQNLSQCLSGMLRNKDLFHFYPFNNEQLGSYNVDKQARREK